MQEAWSLLDIYFRDHLYPFTKHHLDSYREFLRTHIPNTIRSYNPITMIKEDASGKEVLRVEVYMGGKNGDAVFLERPTLPDDQGQPTLLTPQEARLRDITYAVHLFVDVHVEYYKDGAETPVSRSFPMTFLGSIPLMLHSEPCLLHGQGSKVLQGLGECPMDPGGYFIVDGKEKVVIAQERITTNRLFIAPMEKDANIGWKAAVRCTADQGETVLLPKTVELLVLRKPDPMWEEALKEEWRPWAGAILVRLPAIRGTFPLSVLFRALGVETDQQMVHMICGTEVHAAFADFLRPTVVHGASTRVYSMMEALEYLKPRTQYESVQQVRSILSQDLFPHLPESMSSKAWYLAYLVSETMKTALGMQAPSDRDSYLFKRVDISGFLLAQLFQEAFGSLRKHVRDSLDAEWNYGPWKNTGVIEDLVRADNITSILPYQRITEAFHRSLKGMWGVEDDPEQGKVQDLARISYLGFLSHLRRVNTPLDRTIKVTSPHRLHSQQWGIMCPFESPDGASIGYLKNFSLLTQITFGTSSENLRRCFEDLDVVPLEHVTLATFHHPDYVRVFLNGSLVGMTTTPQRTVRALRLFRRNGILNPFVSVSWNVLQRDIMVQTEAGRPCRPLLIVEKGKPLLAQHAEAIQHGRRSWYDLVFGSRLAEKDRSHQGYYRDTYLSPFERTEFAHKDLSFILDALESSQACMEYLDIEEENTCLLAMRPEDLHGFHTHLEIHPSTIASVVTLNVPFANHNQGPRIIFHGAQSKQAIGVYSTNFHKRFDTMAYIQHYPQKSIVTTRGAHYNGTRRMPNGCNVIVAVASYSGFNQEDGIILNKTSVDRGLFHITAYKTLVAKEKSLNPRERIIFGNPIHMRDQGKPVQRIQHAHWQLLDERGFVQEESYIPRGQKAAVMGMLHVRQNVREQMQGVFAQKVVEETYTDISKVTDVHHYGRVDRVFVTEQTPGQPSRICKVRFRKVRRPELGDKACSLHGQKGVFGMVLPQEDMPFTKDGIVPDLIINPHAFPSRMTIGHLVETVMAKVSCLEGSYGDGTLFLPFDPQAMYNRLESHGMERYGNEVMYHGRTGLQIPTEIFMGPIFYYRLKHMVTDKIHARSQGPRVMLTHQPTSGRSKQGGLRVGEMERDVLLGHGLSQFAKECMMEKSDMFTWAVCRHCGTLAKYAPKQGLAACHGCDHQDLHVLQTPYCFKLLMQEMEALGVQIRLADEAPPESPYASDEENEEDAQPLETLPMEAPMVWSGGDLGLDNTSMENLNPHPSSSNVAVLLSSPLPPPTPINPWAPASAVPPPTLAYGSKVSGQAPVVMSPWMDLPVAAATPEDARAPSPALTEGSVGSAAEPFSPFGKSQIVEQAYENPNDMIKVIEIQPRNAASASPLPAPASSPRTGGGQRNPANHEDDLYDVYGEEDDDFDEE